MKRNIYDKSCFNAVTGALHRLQTVFNIPVIAGETLSIRLRGNLRLSQLVRHLLLDCHVHLAFWYVRHRWCYDGTGGGLTWEDMIKNSIRAERATPSTFETITTSNVADSDCYGSVGRNRAIPAHYVKGYNKIWNKGYRVPNVTDEIAVATPASSIPDCKYGLRCARLPNWWDTGIPTTRITATDYDTVASAASFDLVDFAKIQAEYQDEIDRDWFAHRYQDIIAQKWGATGITNEVDDAQAELLYDTSTFLSGYDVDGTDAASLGEFVGKSQGVIDVQLPPRYFNEHGMVWCVALLRFPSIMEDEKHYLANNTLTVDNLLAYPEVVRSTPPEEYTEDDVSANSGALSYGYFPSYNYYRTNNNRVSADFKAVAGFPFITDDDIDNATDITYGGSYDIWPDQTEMSEFFTNRNLAHWNLVSKAEIESRSPLPTATEGLYAGTRHIN